MMLTGTESLEIDWNPSVWNGSRSQSFLRSESSTIKLHKVFLFVVIFLYFLCLNIISIQLTLQFFLYFIKGFETNYFKFCNQKLSKQILSIHKKTYLFSLQTVQNLSRKLIILESKLIKLSRASKMFLDEQEEYMSEPIDQISQSSYIKINKKFLEELKQTNRIDDLSRYRQDSNNQQGKDDQDTQSLKKINKKQKTSNNYFTHQKVQLENSPIKSMSYRDVLDLKSWNQNLTESIAKSNDSKNLQQNNHTAQDKYELIKMTQKISKLTHIDKKQICTPLQKTFEYYLLRKSQDQKQKDNLVLKTNLLEENLEIKHQLFSPKNPSSFVQGIQNQQKVEFQRTNYKKLLQNQISKNKQLQKQVYKLESKIACLNLDYEQSIKQNKRLEKQLHNTNKIRKQNKNQIKQLDQKLEGFKNVSKIKNSQKNQLVYETKKQNKILKDQNQKYRVFIETLAESIFVLKGKKPKNLQDIWSDWKQIFETFSKDKWSLNKNKCPNKKA